VAVVRKEAVLRNDRRVQPPARVHARSAEDEPLVEGRTRQARKTGGREHLKAEGCPQRATAWFSSFAR